MNKNVGDKNKTLSIKQYLDKIRSYYTKYIKNNLIKYNLWKDQLTVVMDFKSSKYNDAKHLIHSKKDNIDY